MALKLQSSFLLLVVGLLSSIPTSFSQGICGENPVQGLDDMKRGYDITTYTFHEHQKPAHMKEDIFEYTCKHNYSFYYNQTKFTYPDQFQAPTLNDVAYNGHRSFIDHFDQFLEIQRGDIVTDDMIEFFEKLGKNATENQPELKRIGDAVGEISKLPIPPQNKTLLEYTSFLRNTEIHSICVKQKYFVHLLKFKDPEHLVLRDDFIKAYNALPGSFLDNPEPFLGFISRFGTHYMHKTKFGGRIIYRTKHIFSFFIFSSSRKYHKEGVEKELDILFSDNNNSARKDTGSYIEIRSEVLGGNLLIPFLPYNSKNIEAWTRSVDKIQSPIWVSFVPIARLIANESISFQVAQAIVYKIKKETLEKCNVLMEIIKPKHYYLTVLDHYSRKNLDKYEMEYGSKYDRVNELLNISLSDKDPRNLVNIITKNTNEIETKVYSLTKIFENVPR